MTPGVNNVPLRPPSLALRGFEILIVSVIVLLASPIFIIAAIAIFALDRGPLIYCQERVGLGQRPFRIYKFRSMVVNASEIGSYQTVEKDPRITSVGRWLRKTSIDELPQLFNVIRGELALVGPRPDTLQQARLYDPTDWALRCSVRPGITGLAQVMYKKTDTKKSRLELDLEYVRHKSVFLDLKILARTILVVLQTQNS